MCQIRNKTAPLTFSDSIEKISHDTQQTFHNLTIKFLKPHLAKANSESHIEGLPSGMTFSKILKKKLNHFRSLNLNWNWNDFHLLTKRGLMTKP